MTDSPSHEWFRPRLAALVAQASQAGFAPDVSVAVITDLINGPAFNPGEPAADENWNQDIGEPSSAANQIIDQDQSSSENAVPIGTASAQVPLPEQNTFF